MLACVMFCLTGCGARQRTIDFKEHLDETVLDHSCGSWFHQLDRHNQVKQTVWPGKPDIYHALQAMLIPYSDVSVSIAKACYNKALTDRS